MLFLTFASCIRIACKLIKHLSVSTLLFNSRYLTLNFLTSVNVVKTLNDSV